VWGVAYRIPQESLQAVLEYLDIREMNGYTTHQTTFHPAASTGIAKSFSTLVYIGTPDNPQFVGNPPPEVDELAEHIWRSVGPSGENRDYLYNLDVALRELCPEAEDEHIHDLADRVRKIEEERGVPLRAPPEGVAREPSPGLNEELGEEVDENKIVVHHATAHPSN